MTKKREALDKAKQSWNKIVEWWKEFWKWIYHVVKWISKALWHAIKGGYHLIDAWDKAIWEKITEKKKEKWENKISKTRNFFRNNIMKLLIAWSILWYEGTEAIQHYRDSDWYKKIHNHNESKWNSNDVLLIPTEWYDLLKRKPITTKAPLTRWYLGWDLEKSWDLIITDTLTLNPAESLHNLWSEKIRKYGQSTKDINTLDTIDVKSMSKEDIEKFKTRFPIDGTYLFVVKPYIDWNENKNTMSFDQFITKTNNIIKNLKSDTKDYDGWLTGHKKDLFDAIRNNITWECIVAYAMTELCENKENGEFNKQLFNILLQNSGVNYLSKIPAIYDWKTSYGLYQFTEYALHDLPWDVRWASIVNKSLPNDKKIPWSVIDLNSREHQTKAAYMFALYNLNLAVKKLNDDQAKALLDYQKANQENFRDNITQLIAMCHHRPADAVALKKRHENKHKNNVYQYGKAMTYGKASKNNYEALKK